MVSTTTTSWGSPVPSPSTKIKLRFVRWFNRDFNNGVGFFRRFRRLIFRRLAQKAVGFVYSQIATE